MLTAPLLFSEGLQSAEDYSLRFCSASLVRLLRYFAFAVTVWLPGFFLAVVQYHVEIIPFRLLLSMTAAEAATPFSTGVSLLLIGVIYEVLREAGIRLPKPAGQAISIVGAIVMGDAAVAANLISAPVLIVLAITVVASFVAVAYVDAALVLRNIMLFAAWAAGLLGLLLASMVLLIYLCSLTSCGVPFLAPFSPLDRAALKDTLIRFPLRELRFRPRALSANRRRQGGGPS